MNMVPAPTQLGGHKEVSLLQHRRLYVTLTSVIGVAAMYLLPEGRHKELAY